ncbi:MULTISPECIES: phosphodiesterase [Persicobacter]|nr:phosphodiesterase [Persicobacter sp. CCB-QB2]
MKIIFISDIHGSATFLEKALAVVESEKPDQIILVGDAMYHGPRNPLPEGYAPAKVASLLNNYKDRIIAVRGNCDSEVDQMLLEFPMMGDYAVYQAEGIYFYITHGHLASPEQAPALKAGSIFVSGHTHIPVATKEKGLYFFNPGSIALPKGGFAPSYGIFDQNQLIVKDFEGNVIKSVEIEK